MRLLITCLVIVLMSLRLVSLSPLFDHLFKVDERIIASQMIESALIPGTNTSQNKWQEMLEDKQHSFSIENMIAKKTAEEVTFSALAYQTPSTAEIVPSNEAIETADAIYDPILQEKITLTVFNGYDCEQLQRFKGIGVKTAEAIVAYRECNGPFKTFEELTAVKGIGEKKLNQLLSKENE